MNYFYRLSNFLRRSLVTFISKSFRTIVFVFIGVFFHNVLAALSSGLPQVSPVHLGIGEIEKLGMADHIWIEKRSHLPLWDELK